MTNSPRGITAAAGTAFAGVLLSLVVKACLDTAFHNVTKLHYFSDLCRIFMADPEGSALLLLQVIVLMFTLVRFYWGVFRYHEEVPIEGGDHWLLFGLFFTIIVFSAFYVSALLVRAGSLFLFALLAIHCADLIWFVLVRLLLNPSRIMRKTMNRFILFDIITSAFLGICIYLNWQNRDSSPYQYLFFANIAMLVIGLIDFRWLWPFYARTKT